MCKRRIVLVIAIFFIIVTLMISCRNDHQTTSSPPSEVTVASQCTQYTPTDTIKQKLQEASISFNQNIPIPTCLPKGYVISEIQVIQLSDLKMDAELAISASFKADITLSIVWWSSGGPFRILPSSTNYKSEDVTGGPGTYSNAVLNYLNEKNTLWWDWMPENPPGNQSPYYELVLSAGKDVPEESLLAIARSVRIPA
jgi:hypothetical protein